MWGTMSEVTEMGWEKWERTICRSRRLIQGRRGREEKRTWTWRGEVTAKLTRTKRTLLPVPSTPLTTRPNQVQKKAIPTNSARRSLKRGEARAGQLVSIKT